jgi:hypothetical protein
MKIITAVAMAGLLLAAPAVAQTQTTTPAPKPAAKPSARAASTATVHATKGVVKSVSATSLVIAKAGGKGPEMTFELDASTQKQGELTVGASVDVRYHAEGKTKVATAVSVQDAKSHAPKPAPGK